MSFLLFYSNGCKYSKKFLYYIDTYNVSSDFIKICVDKLRKTNTRPRHVYDYKITEVPTIISTDMNLRLSGAKAFKFLADNINNKTAHYTRRQEDAHEDTHEDRGYDQRDNIQDPKYTSDNQDVNYQYNTRDNNAPEPAIVRNKSKKKSQYLESKTSVISNFTDPFCKVGENRLSNIPDNIDDDSITRRNNFRIEDDFSSPVPVNKSIKVKKGSLIEKQLDNKYNQIMAERDLDTPKIVRV
jgi:hypothetical protein